MGVGLCSSYAGRCGFQAPGASRLMWLSCACLQPRRTASRQRERAQPYSKLPPACLPARPPAACPPRPAHLRVQRAVLEAVEEGLEVLLALPVPHRGLLACTKSMHGCRQGHGASSSGAPWVSRPWGRAAVQPLPDHSKWAAAPHTKPARRRNSTQAHSVAPPEPPPSHSQPSCCHRPAKSQSHEPTNPQTHPLTLSRLLDLLGPRLQVGLPLVAPAPQVPAEGGGVG